MHRNKSGTYSPSQRARDRDRGRHARPTQDYRPGALLQIPLTSRERLLAAASNPSPAPTTADSSATTEASPFNWLDLDRDYRADDDDAKDRGDLYFAIAADELHALSPPGMSTPEKPERAPTGESGESAAGASSAAGAQRPEGELAVEAPQRYKTYRRRWFGLLQLVLLNIVVSWDVRLSVDRSFGALTSYSG
jgi:hypothetical protein